MNNECKHKWDKATGIKKEGKPWIGLKSRWIRTCLLCGAKQLYTNDGMYHGWFNEL